MTTVCINMLITVTSITNAGAQQTFRSTLFKNKICQDIDSNVQT